MNAYFLGGSWDLTKRVMKDCPPVLEVSVFPRMPVREAPSPKDYEIMETVTITQEFYRRIRHDSEKEVTIYLFEEWMSR